MNVGITGFAGTGSSAVQDYLKEFSGVDVALEEVYEHMVFLVPHSIFDLELKLFENNDPMRSDEAIQSFYLAMKQLYEYDFTWFGSYKKLVGPSFMEVVEDYIKEISLETSEIWYYRYKGTRFNPVKYVVQKTLNVLKVKNYPRVGYDNVYDKSKGYLSYCTREEFNIATKRFTSRIMELTKTTAEISLFDHLLWPKQCYHMETYFNDDVKMIIVKRDPRDLYLINKYFWAAKNVAVNFPMEASEFAKYYQNVMKLDYSRLDDHKVLVVNFEDLVYDYQETTKTITNFLGLKDENHVHKKKYFDPVRSIKNTQVFTSNPAWAEEIACIEELLKEDCYPFTQNSSTSMDEMFV